MRKDYHMHPTVIQTPERFEQFVQRAVAKGIREICVTDHMPLSVSTASDRMPKGTVKNYCDRVRSLARQYEDVLTVRCGIEIDYHPSVEKEIEAVLSEGDFDVVLGSSHTHVFVKDYQRYTFNQYADLALDNSIRAVQTGWFDILTHPDMYRWLFSDPKRFPLTDDGYEWERHRGQWESLLADMEKHRVRLEINPHLAESKKEIGMTYPQQEIVSLALEKGIGFSYGSDAHKPESVGACLEELEQHPVYGEALRRWEDET